MGGSPCRMSITRNSNVALLNLRKPHVTLSISRKLRVALSILRKPCVECREGCVAMSILGVYTSTYVRIAPIEWNCMIVKM